VIGFYYWTGVLRADATEASKKQAQANNSQSNIQTLQSIQNELERDKAIVDRASNIVAESQSYQYQDQIINDITNYATRAGIEITNIDFSTTKTAATSATTSQQTQQTAPTPSGVKSSSVSVTLKNPVDYTNLLRFIHSIEQNLTKMQISRVGLSKEATGGITSDVLTIEVYVR
jgi:glycine cleavage system regulatory protein